MQILVPLPVPWMVAPSTPQLSVYTGDEETGCRVEFVGLFGHVPEVRGQPNTQVQLVSGLPNVDPIAKTGRYQLISLRFKNAGWVSRRPQHSDREVIEEASYEWAKVDGARRPDEQVHAWRSRCTAQWQVTGLAPDPSAYLIENSTWRRQDAERWSLNHYLVLGDSCFVELLAAGFEWESKGNVLGW